MSYFALLENEDDGPQEKQVVTKQPSNNKSEQALSKASKNTKPTAKSGGGGGGGSKAPKREFDRHSGTGRDKSGKKDGAGKGNWGVDTEGADEPAAKDEDAEKRPVRAPREAEPVEEEEEEDNSVLASEAYAATEAAKAALDASLAVRQVVADDKMFKVIGDFDDVNPEEEDEFAALKIDKNFRKKTKAAKKTKILSIDQFAAAGPVASSRPAREERPRAERAPREEGDRPARAPREFSEGKGGRGRGGKGGDRGRGKGSPREGGRPRQDGDRAPREGGKGGRGRGGKGGDRGRAGPRPTGNRGRGAAGGSRVNVNDESAFPKLG